MKQQPLTIAGEATINSDLVIERNAKGMRAVVEAIKSTPSVYLRLQTTRESLAEQLFASVTDDAQVHFTGTVAGIWYGGVFQGPIGFIIDLESLEVIEKPAPASTGELSAVSEAQQG